MPRPVKRLTNMEIDEISLVDKGANQHAMITIAKRAPEEELMPELYNEDGEVLDQDSLEDGQIVFDDEGNAYQFSEDVEEEVEEPEFAEVGKGFGQIASGVKAGLKGVSGPQSTLGGSRGMAVGAHLRNNKLKYGIGAAGVAAGAGASQMRKSFKDEVLEELSKAYSDTDRDEVIAKALGRVEELENKYQAASEIAKSERDLRLTREYISKAAEYNLPVDPAQLGPVLYRMAETMDYDDCVVIAKCLEAAGTMLFQEAGYQGGGDNTDIMSQVEARAVEIGKSADPITITNVFEQSPEAYDEYLAQRRY